MRRRTQVALGVLAGLALLALGFAGGYVVAKKNQSADVRGNPTQEFIPTQAPTAKPPPLPGVSWPTWGFDAVHNRVSPYAHRPPLRVAWTFRARSLH